MIPGTLLTFAGYLVVVAASGPVGDVPWSGIVGLLLLWTAILVLPPISGGTLAGYRATGGHRNSVACGAAAGFIAGFVVGYGFLMRFVMGIRVPTRPDHTTFDVFVLLVGYPLIVGLLLGGVNGGLGAIGGRLGHRSWNRREGALA